MSTDPEYTQGEALRREEADRIENQWHISGEELDMVIRDIQRLEKKLK